MKKLILTIVALITMTSVQAQNNNNSRGERRQFDQTEMLKKRTDETAKKYGLNEEQTAKLLELNTKYADKIGGSRDGRRMGARPSFDGNRNRNRQQGQRTELTEEQKQEMQKQRAERQAAMEQYTAELQAIMTPEQYKAYKADMEKNMMRQGPARRNSPRGEQKQD